MFKKIESLPFLFFPFWESDIPITKRDFVFLPGRELNQDWSIRQGIHLVIKSVIMRSC